MAQLDGTWKKSRKRSRKSVSRKSLSGGGWAKGERAWLGGGGGVGTKKGGRGNWNLSNRVHTKKKQVKRLLKETRSGTGGLGRRKGRMITGGKKGGQGQKRSGNLRWGGPKGPFF